MDHGIAIKDEYRRSLQKKFHQPTRKNVCVLYPGESHQGTNLFYADDFFSRTT